MPWRLFCIRSRMIKARCPSLDSHLLSISHPVHNFHKFTTNLARFACPDARQVVAVGSVQAGFPRGYSRFLFYASSTPGAFARIFPSKTARKFFLLPNL